MPYAVIRISRETLDEMIRERLRPDAESDWTYEVVVEVESDQLLKEIPDLPRMEGRPDAPVTEALEELPLARAIQTVAPA